MTAVQSGYQTQTGRRYRYAWKIDVWSGGRAFVVDISREEDNEQLCRTVQVQYRTYADFYWSARWAVRCYIKRSERAGRVCPIRGTA